MLIVVREAHESAEKVEALVSQGVVATAHDALHLNHISCCEACHVGCLELVVAPRKWNQILHRKAWYGHLLSARYDGRQQQILTLGDEQEDGLLPGLLKDFKYLVGCLVVHRLGLPYNHNLILRLEALER